MRYGKPTVPGLNGPVLGTLDRTQITHSIKKQIKVKTVAQARLLAPSLFPAGSSNAGILSRRTYRRTNRR